VQFVLEAAPGRSEIDAVQYRIVVRCQYDIMSVAATSAGMKYLRVDLRASSEVERVRA
jgi:hypothetical protein